MEKNMIINYVYQNILRKFYESMQNINITQSENNIDYIKNQFSEIIELLRKCQNDTISIEAIELLNDISFNDFLKDKYIIEAVSSNKIELNNSNIFVMKEEKKVDDYRSYFRIIERDGQYIAISYCDGNIEERTISVNELNSFTTLSKTLHDSEYVGYSANRFERSSVILYSGKIYKSEKFFTLYYRYRDKSLQLYVTDKSYSNNGFFYDIYRTEKCKPYIESEDGERHIDNTDGLKDREFILKAIEEQLVKQYGIPGEGKGTKKPAVLVKSNN